MTESCRQGGQLGTKIFWKFLTALSMAQCVENCSCEMDALTRLHAQDSKSDQTAATIIVQHPRLQAVRISTCFQFYSLHHALHMVRR